MTAREMSDLIDVKLNSYNVDRTFGYPPTDITLDEYEKSLFLTEAQNELVQCAYQARQSTKSDALTVFAEGFENSEFNRKILQPLIRDASISIGGYQSSPLLGSESIEYFNLYQDLNNQLHVYTIQFNESPLAIVYEGALLSGDACSGLSTAQVIPTSLDELHKILNNPFKQPNNKRILRLDIANNSVQLVTNQIVADYVCRYLSKPSPIITTTLPSDLAIEGYNITTDCELNSITHNAIVDAAIEIAYRTKILNRPAPAVQQANSK